MSEIATTDRRELAPIPRSGAYIVAEALVQETEQRKLLGQYVAHHMSEGTDYGVIPGTKNTTLLKPGAEKLTQLFRCVPRYAVVEKIENWETGLFYYRFGCSIVTQDSEIVVAEGVGSCSTYESRYRWRKADRSCPLCGATAILRSKFPPKESPEEEPGWYCFGRKGGCGANFAADDAAITSQATGRVQNPDLLDSVNTVLKIAKKRALVDASIALARCSDIFTQDMEDVVGEEKAAPSGVNSDRKVEQHPAPVNPLIAELKAERERTGKAGADGWQACLTWINSQYPSNPAYPPGTKIGDIHTTHIEALVAALKAKPATQKAG